MPLTLLSLAAAPLLTLSQATVQDVAKPTNDTPAALEAELRDRRTKWMAAYREDPKEAQKLGPYPNINGLLDRAWKLVDPDASSEAAGDVLCWIARERAEPEALNKALSLLRKHHLQHDGLTQVCAALLYQITPEIESFLRAVHDGSPTDKVRHQAQYSLAKVLLRRASAIDSLSTLEGKEREERVKAYESFYGKKTVALLAREKSDELRKHAEKYLDQLVATADATGKRSIVARAQNDLYELRNLAIGMPAPEIEGEDVEGVKFSLSDYRGKVVVLDFWGDW